MQRDMDLCRAILLQMEQHEHGYAPKIEVEGYSREQIAFHVFLLYEAGLLHAAESTTSGQQSPSAIPIRLTWAGCDFLDAARPLDRWQQASAIGAKAGGLTFDVLKTVLVKLTELGVRTAMGGA